MQKHFLKRNEGKTASIYFRFKVNKKIRKHNEAKRKYGSKTKQKKNVEAKKIPK
jgi:hypothetical protein